MIDLNVQTFVLQKLDGVTGSYLPARCNKYCMDKSTIMTLFDE